MKLDLQTLEFVRQKAVEFARREWKNGDTNRSDAITDFVCDIDRLIDDAKLQEIERKREFDDSLENVHKALEIMQKYCACTILVTEGAHSYGTPSEVDSRGACKMCHKPKFKEES